jgi:phosphoserine/homoserine phosphotransferase
MTINIVPSRQVARRAASDPGPLVSGTLRCVIIACLDMEGVLVPEIWINVAERTGIEALRRTTRDEPDYDVLMRARLEILDQNRLGIRDIQRVIAEIDPLEGARDCLDWLRRHFQVVVLSDTFYQFAEPLMRKLGFPTLFCNDLEIDDSGHIVGYRLRIPDQKRESVIRLGELNFQTIAAGDSYNDMSMLAVADAGILFRPPDNVIAEFPQYPVTRTYEEFRREFEAAVTRLEKPRT